eukprot:COSAG01_NODE_29941_length_626_cov_1.514231_1_plen_175_part_00
MVALPPTGFPSLPHLRACAPPTRFAGPPQLTRPDGLVVCGYGLLTIRPPLLANASSMEQRPPPSSAPDCCRSQRVRRPVARRCGGGVPSLLHTTVARRFRWAGAGRRAPSARKRPKRGGRTSAQGRVAACTPRHLSFPASLRCWRTCALTLERHCVIDWLRARVKGVDVRVCAR